MGERERESVSKRGEDKMTDRKDMGGERDCEKKKDREREKERGRRRELVQVAKLKAMAPVALNNHFFHLSSERPEENWSGYKEAGDKEEQIEKAECKVRWAGKG